MGHIRRIWFGTYWSEGVVDTLTQATFVVTTQLIATHRVEHFTDIVNTLPMVELNAANQQGTRRDLDDRRRAYCTYTPPR